MYLKTSVMIAAFTTIVCGTKGVNIKQDEDNPIWAHILKQFQEDLHLPRLNNQRQHTLRNTDYEDVPSPSLHKPSEFPHELYDLARVNEKVKNNRKKIKQLTVSTWNSSVPKKANEDYSVSRLKYASRNTHDYVSNEDLLEKYNNLEGAKKKEFQSIKIGFHDPKQTAVSSNIELESLPSIQELVKLTLNQEHTVKDTPHVNRLPASPGEHVYARFNQNFQPNYLLPSGHTWANRPYTPEYVLNDNKSNSQAEHSNNYDSNCRCRKSVSARSATRKGRQRSPSRRVRIGARSQKPDIFA